MKPVYNSDSSDINNYDIDEDIKVDNIRTCQYKFQEYYLANAKKSLIMNQSRNQIPEHKGNIKIAVQLPTVGDTEVESLSFHKNSSVHERNKLHIPLNEISQSAESNRWNFSSFNMNENNPSNFQDFCDPRVGPGNNNEIICDICKGSRGSLDLGVTKIQTNVCGHSFHVTCRHKAYVSLINFLDGGKIKDIGCVICWEMNEEDMED